VTHRRGSDHPASKLSEADAAFIRASRLTLGELAVRFNVSKATISLVRRGLRRGALTDYERLAQSEYRPTSPPTAPIEPAKPIENLPQVHRPDEEKDDLLSVAYPTKSPDIDSELGVTNLSENDIKNDVQKDVYIKRDIDARDDVWTSDMDMSLLCPRENVTTAKSALRGSLAFPGDEDGVNDRDGHDAKE
jgi:transcriptional regulator with XRE-family HTH domain